MEFLIRKMRVEAIPQVRGIAQTSWNFTFEGIIPRNIQRKDLQLLQNDNFEDYKLKTVQMVLDV